ncbi:hypothetical protein [uncultured Dietzia sp.]|jgi:hypothetical protein|uniref:hypothetical protein n=2 Tax=Dietzia TaxID=37914 RepID=UPI002627C671|nr:hypothetical protein [uncultured Dietzia sp.]
MVPRRGKLVAASVLTTALVAGGCGASFGGAGANGNGVHTLPRIAWEGGPEYWSRFANAGDWTDPGFFPIGLWYGTIDDADHARADKAAGLTFYTGGLWEKTDFAALRQSGMYWVGGRVNPTFDDTSRYWPGVLLDDEVDGRFTPAEGFAHLDERRKAMTTDDQFSYANFTNMVVGPELPLADRLRYVNTFADVVSLDMYFYTVPFCAAGDAYRGHLYDGRIPESTCRTASSYGRFVGALRDLDARDSRLVPIWNFVEVMSGANDDGAFVRYMEPEEIRGAAMSSIINEARGIVWFQQSLGGPCKSTQPVRQAQELGEAFCGFRQVEAMTLINRQILELAPVLNTQSLQWHAADESQTMLKVHEGQAYLFAMTDGGTGTRTFALPGGLDDTATVVNEDRTVKIDDGRLTDDFPTESTYHVYRIALRE